MTVAIHKLKLNRKLKSATLVGTTPGELTDDSRNEPIAAREISNPSVQSGQPLNIAFDIDEIVANIIAEIQELEQRRCDSINEIRQLALEIALAATSKVFMREIADGQYPLQEIIESMIDKFGETPVTICLNPRDFTALNEKLVDKESILGDANLTFAANREINPGGCRIESTRFELLRDPRLQIEQLRQTILEIMDDASIERRQTESANSKLQRFPDRRSAS